jgi:hypothetical protein
VGGGGVGGWVGGKKWTGVCLGGVGWVGGGDEGTTGVIYSARTCARVKTLQVRPPAGRR